MKALVLSLAFCISSYAFADAATDMVSKTLKQGEAILADKSTDTRNVQLCALVASSMDADSIGQVLLGQYEGISTDKAGVKLFYNEMPSLAVTALIKNLGSAAGGSVAVDSDSTDNGNGTWSVGVTLTQSNGSSYYADIILDKVKGHFRIVDGTYMGFSGFQYLGGQMQKDMGNESDTAHPVSAYMKQQMANPNWIECN